MKQGDVFKVRNETQLYRVEAVTPSGSIYAHKFDLYTGAYDEPVAFKEKDELTVLFNDLQPEQEEGWEYCEIKHVTDWNADGTGYEWFEAEATGPSGNYSVGKSSRAYFVRGEPMSGLNREQIQKIHQTFIDKLLSQGWEIVLERRLTWFQLRLKRKHQPAKPEPTGWLDSLFGRQR